MADKVCIVIGGGKGMGAAIAREMKKRNYRLSLMSPSENCERLANELGGIAYRGRAENNSDTKEILVNIMTKYNPLFETPTAYYLYNYGVRPVEEFRVCIIN